MCVHECAGTWVDLWWERKGVDSLTPWSSDNYSQRSRHVRFLRTNSNK